MSDFNVATDPWIQVTMNGQHKELSLQETLKKAHLITGLSGATGQEDVAVLRLLSACVAHLYPNTGDAGVDWKRAFTARSFPDFADYFKEHHEEFSLFSETPFYQVQNPGVSGTLAKLVLGAATNPTRAVLSSTAPESLSYAEATRALVTKMLWDVAGIHSGAPDDPRTKSGRAYSPSYNGITLLAHNPVSYGGALIVEGKTLKDTILLNTPFTARAPGDQPLWERGARLCEQTFDAAGKPIVPTGLVSYLTWAHRSIWLERDETTDRVISAFVSYGDIVNHCATLYDYEPAVSWYFKEKGKRYLPSRLNRQSIWEGLPSATGFAPDTNKVAPDVAALAVRHLQELVADEHIKRVSDVVTGYTEVSWVLGSNDSVVSGVSVNRLQSGHVLTSELPTQAATIASEALTALQRSVYRAFSDGLVPEETIQVAMNEFRQRVDTPYRELVALNPGPREARTALTEWREAMGVLAQNVYTTSLTSYVRPGRMLAFARGARNLTHFTSESKVA